MLAVSSSSRGENRIFSHPRTGDAAPEKIAEKTARNSEVLNFNYKVVASSVRFFTAG